MLMPLLNTLCIADGTRQFLVRKVAHFLEFSILSLLWAGVFQGKQLHIPFVFSMLTAVVDEYIQRYIPGRNGQIKDVLLDCSGAATALLLLWLVLAAISKHRKRESQET